MFAYTDQTGRKISLESVPKRIISLVPSMTELLFDLGLGERVVGVTKFCHHPLEAKSRKIIGGTKSVHYDRIQELQPDLVIGNKEENTLEIVQTLEKDYPVWIADVNTLEELYEMNTLLGEVLAVEKEANELNEEIRTNFSSIVKNENKSARVAYLIWREPYMAVGTDTFIDKMIAECGFENVVKESRYPEVKLSEYNDLDAILLSSEPYPFKEKHLEELQKSYPKTTIKLVDGELFSWVGSRIKYAPAYFNDLIKELK
ncbi:ABC-type Fe3+-hydroxamate transport system substrate-binding protein [Sediminitomix flava]|uniref:ABC-type Fe3+-hydroxamate transport system substrate-binding protein n=2 Tax=Sediminitomix flava TaxID=379075 RepID=A0A315ZDM8_SEDFL|nr:ABC-type Fe3+-hydroxamate transport system substrate-binding protein [Sediminitomix flava]